MSSLISVRNLKYENQSYEENANTKKKIKKKNTGQEHDEVRVAWEAKE